MKKLALIIALAWMYFDCAGQVMVYKDGQLQARGYVTTTGNKTISVRTMQNNRFVMRSFFKSGLDSLVILDSASAAQYNAAIAEYPTNTIVRVERADFDFEDEYKPAPAVLDLAPKASHIPDDLNVRATKAHRHIGNASTSMIASVAASLVGSVLVYDILSKATTQGQIRDAGVAAFAFSGLSLGLFINGLMQNNKAQALLSIK